jgi:hypothetical protein
MTRRGEDVIRVANLTARFHVSDVTQPCGVADRVRLSDRNDHSEK